MGGPPDDEGERTSCLLCGEDLEPDARACTCERPKPEPRSHLLEVVMTARATGARSPEAMRVALERAARAHREEPN